MWIEVNVSWGKGQHLFIPGTVTAKIFVLGQSEGDFVVSYSFFLTQECTEQLKI